MLEEECGDDEILKFLDAVGDVDVTDTWQFFPSFVLEKSKVVKNMTLMRLIFSPKLIIPRSERSERRGILNNIEQK